MTRTQLKTFEKFTDIACITQNPFIAVDLLQMLCGEKIGEGQFRAVYEYSLSKEVVVKISIIPASNLMEFALWQKVKNTSLKKWFAPCISISPCGHFLMQKRVRGVTDKDKLPSRLPAFFTDTKKTNFGFIGKQLVCHDYHLCNVVFPSFEKTTKTIWKK